MNKLFQFIKETEKYTQPNSFVSFLDNKVALVIFFFIKKFRFLSPNLITGFSFILFLISITFFVFNFNYLFVLFLFLAYTFDNVDGIWARFYSQTSVFGAWLDSTLDRVKDITILIVFVFIFKGLLNTTIVMSVFFYSLFLILALHSKVYFNLENHKDNNISKKFRIIAFGPAEFYLLLSVIVLLPDKYKILPSLLLMLIIIVFSFSELKKVLFSLYNN